MVRRKRTQFWGANEDDDSLILEILAGRKTATACQAHEYYKPAGEFDDGGMETDDLVDVFDLKGRLRCVIRITDVYRFSFGEIPDRLWRAEGCSSAEAFRAAHRKAWPHENLTDDFELIGTHFMLAEAKHEPGAIIKVTKAYSRSFPNPPRARVGETVEFQRLDAKNPTWFFGRSGSGVEGYFPVGWFRIDEAKRTAIALRDYDANELTVEPGEPLEVREDYSQWVFVNRQGEMGWVPKECVE